MQKPKFIGTISLNQYEATIGAKPWEPIHFDYPPYQVITPPPNYLFTLGSGCYPSMATTSSYGITYNSGIDVFRQDIRNSRLHIDVDHYIAGVQKDFASVYLEPPTAYHHLSLSNDIVDYIAPEWKQYIRKNLGKSPV